jgi:hypothetical protein
MKILLVRNLGFGDTIWTEPIVRYFLAQEEVVIQTAHPSIFEHYPSSRLSVNCPEKMFPMSSWPILLRFEERPKMHILEGFCQASNIEDMELSYPQLHLSPSEKIRKISKDYCILHLDQFKSQLNFRNVYGINWEEVVHDLRARGLEPIQISKTGKSLVTNWLPTRDFREVMSLIYHCKLFIGLDSGPSHIAASFRIPSVIFFGSVNPEYRHLDRVNKVFLQSPCPFAHCYHELPNSFGQPCRLVKKGEKPPCCIQDTAHVLEAIRVLL